MIDPLQLVLMIVISTLTILLVVIGIEVFRILREAKQTLHRVNQVLTGIETITSSIATPVSKLSSLVQGVQQGATVMHVLSKFLEVIHKKKAS